MSETIRQGEAISPRTFGPFDEADVRRYAEASGDDNPLHVDPSIAAKAGLRQPPIHGMLIMGCLQTFVADWRSDATLRKLSAKFIQPVLVGESINVSGKVVQVSSETAVIRLMVKNAENALVCLAEAFVAS